MNTIPFLIRKTKEDIINCLNQSGLHIDILDMILHEIHTSVHQQAEMEFNRLQVQEAQPVSAQPEETGEEIMNYDQTGEAGE